MASHPRRLRGSWLALLLIPLCCLLGCEESSSGRSSTTAPSPSGSGGSGGGSGSSGSSGNGTANPGMAGNPGSTGNNGNTGNAGSAPAVLNGTFNMSAATPAGAARQAAAVALANQEIEDLWDLLRDDVKIRLENEAQAMASAGTLAYAAGPVTIGVTAINNLSLDMDVPPEFQELSDTRLKVILPRTGIWRIVVDATVGLGLSQLGINLVGVPLRMTIELNALLDAHLDITDPARPAVTNAATPQTWINVGLSSTNALVQPLLPYLNVTAQPLVQTALGLILGTYINFTMQTYPGDVWADGTSPLVDSNLPTPFEEIAINVDQKIRDDHMPDGLVHRLEMDTRVDVEPWDVAYLNGGPGNTGNPVAYDGHSDSAIHTGYYLAAQAFRYASTGDPQALDNVLWTLRGVGALFDINGGSGLMARSAAPASSLVGQVIVQRGAFGSAQLYGDSWVGWQSDSGVSRDQYTGIIFGLAITHELVQDPQVQAECALRVQQALDYLIANDWIITEDRPDWKLPAGSGPQTAGAGPTIWAVQSVYQQLNYLTIGQRMHPGRYDTEHARLEGLAPMTWLGAWLSVNKLDGYYSFNLQMLNAFNYFRYELDQTRWMEMARGYRIVQRWVGQHQNPHFDLIQSAIDPSLAPSLFPSVRESLRQFLTRNHRVRVPPGLNLSGIQWHDFTFGSLFNPLGETETVPTEPIPVPLRRYTGYFQWQKQPVREAIRLIPNDFGERYEKPGVDVDLPYWMGRWFGAF